MPVTALRDERRKRQDLERKLAEYEQQVQRAQAPPPPQRPDLFEDPDGALEHIQTQFRQELTRQRLDMSVTMAKSQHDDYPEAEAAFVAAVHANPGLYDQMMADPHPAGFAYRVGQQVMALREIGPDPVAYRERVRKEYEAELRQGQPEQPADRSPPRQSLPPSLAGGRDTSGRFAPAWGGPPSLKDILAPRRK